ncbi:MAG: flavin reductase family protein [Rhodocyclaceae bacterium]|jgi:flavin reductase (DIM6/NTAB) family NADH-FMN oxidoreductase RutF|nr:flavin reductase family protein [Rhodocyclaceae bacterium]
MNKPIEAFHIAPSSEAAGQRALRNALGVFATGVTVVTMRGAGGEPIGLTVNSFNAVSLDPPLIVWSLSLASPNLESFRGCGHYAVNVLALDQAWLSQRFASREADKFAGLEPKSGLGGAPLLTGCCAWFECANQAQHAGGDHLLFIGRVERHSHHRKEPLVFQGGRYRALRDV